MTSKGKTIALGDVFDTPDLSHTRNLLLAVTTLRQFRDCLTGTITAWQAFEDTNIGVFGLQGCEGLRPRWDEYLSNIHAHVSEMKIMQLLVSQRLELFNDLRDAVIIICTLSSILKLTSALQIMNASALRESGAATQQGDFIRVLTCMTVVYLPLTLATIRTF